MAGNSEFRERLKLCADSFGSAPHGFFLFALGLFGCFHWLSYTFSYAAPGYPSTHLMGLAGLALVLFPLAKLPFLVLIAAMAVDSALQAPVLSNHTMLKNFLLLAILLAGVETLARRESWAFFIQRFAPAGRWLLIGMYFYGVFHKINSAFLDPDVSCAAALWLAMPFPAWITESTFLHVTGIWATFIFEGAIVVLLIFRPTRHLGIFFGIAFHGLLAISGYAFYPTFSTLTIALHCLFLPAWAHLRLAESPLVLHALNRLRSPAGLLLIAIVASAIVGYAAVGMLESAALAWLLVILPFAFLVLHFGREAVDGAERPPGLRVVDSAVLAGRPLWVSLIAVLFFFNGATPYLGLKTAQSFNMFANLRLEGDVSNHLIMTKPPGPFGYLADVVEITGSRGVPYFIYIERNDLRLVYYEFLNRMERAGPEAQVSYRLNGVDYSNRSPADLEAEFERVLHPRWFRAWFHFKPVDLTTPKPCARDR